MHRIDFVRLNDLRFVNRLIRVVKCIVFIVLTKCEHKC